jgi:DNA-binding PadR family transcriptional regulator
MDAPDQLPLAPRDLLILSSLAEGPLHGYGIVRAVGQGSEAGVVLDPANLYRALRRLERSGWVEVVEDADEAGRRRTYAMTVEGASVLRSEMARLERLIERTRPLLPDYRRGGAA